MNITAEAETRKTPSFDEWFSTSRHLEVNRTLYQDSYDKGLTATQAFHLLNLSGGALNTSSENIITSDSVNDWSDQVVNAVINKIGNERLKADIRAFRTIDNSATVSMTLSSENNAERYNMNFVCGLHHNFGLKEVYVPDFIEVFHMIGLLSKPLRFAITMR